MNPLSMVRQCLFGHLSKHNEPPEKACRPFERHRDGIVFGGRRRGLGRRGFGSRTQKRGATRFTARFSASASAFSIVAAPARGFGPRPSTCGACHAGEGDGRRHWAYQRARSQFRPSVDAWEAHRASRKHSATAELPCGRPKAISETWGRWAQFVEIAGSLLALSKHGLLPATLNYEEADPLCPIPVNRVSQPLTNPLFLKLAFTEMGQCERRRLPQMGRSTLMRRRVVITGMGAITPLGHSVGELYQNQLEGKSGVAPITLFDASKFPTRNSLPRSRILIWAAGSTIRNAGRIPARTVASPPPPPTRRLKDAGLLDDAKVDRTRFGVYLGSGEGIQDFHNMVYLIAKSYDSRKRTR